MVDEQLLKEIEQTIGDKYKNLNIPEEFIERILVLFSDKDIQDSCLNVTNTEFLKKIDFEKLKEIAYSFSAASSRLNKISEELDIYLFLKEGYRLDYEGLMKEFEKKGLKEQYPDIDIKVLTDLYAKPPKLIYPYYSTKESIYINPVVYRKFILAILQMVFNEMDLLVVYTGAEGCQPKGSKVMMANGEYKNIEDIKVGDEVLSPQHDNSHIFAKVTDTTSWFCNEVYDVESLNRGKRKLYSCSNNHLIPLNIVREKGHTKRTRYWIKQNVRVDEYNKKKSDYKKNCTSLSCFSIDKFKGRKNCNIEPYTLGVFLGDGSYSEKYYLSKHQLKKGKLYNGVSRSVNITSANPKILEYISNYYPIMNINSKENTNDKSYTFSINSDLSKNLERLKLNWKGSGDKFIPEEALYSDKDYRLKLLAGLIDTDGCLTKNHTYEIITKSKKLAEGIMFLIYSLGMRGTCKETIKGIKRLNFKGKYHRINFYSGDIKIPILLKRKKRNEHSFYLSPNRLSIDVKKTKSQQVYGFSLDSPSKWYITDNYMVTHNTGKSTLATQHMLLIHQILNLANIKKYPYNIKQMMFSSLSSLRQTEDDNFSDKFRQLTLDEGNELHRQNWKEEEVQTFFQRLRRERYNQRIKSICIPVLGELMTNIVMSRVNFIFEVYSENKNKLGILQKGGCNFYIIPRGNTIYSYEHKKDITKDHIKQILYETLDKKNYLKGLPKELVIQKFIFNGTQGFKKEEYIKELKEANKSFNVKEGIKLSNGILYILYRLIKSGKLRPKNVKIGSKEPEYASFHKLIQNIRGYFSDNPRILKLEDEKFSMKH